MSQNVKRQRGKPLEKNQGLYIEMMEHKVNVRREGTLLKDINFAHLLSCYIVACQAKNSDFCFIVPSCRFVR